MTKKLLRPILPNAPDEYDAVYVNQLARTLEQLIDEVRGTNINFQGIPSMGAANVLESGDFFIGDGGFLKIVSVNQVHTGSTIGTAQLGTVEVSVS